MMHYNSVDFLSNFRMSITPAQMLSPPTVDLLAMVLLATYKGKE